MERSFQQHTNEPIGGEEVWKRNGLVLTFIRQQPHWDDYSIHYGDEEQNLVISVATLIAPICFYNELLTTIMRNCVQKVHVWNRSALESVKNCTVKLE